MERVDRTVNRAVSDLGGYIRTQRGNAEISLRQLAKRAGVSNPYLSQVERGLRKPSAEILQQIAKALRISAEALYVQAGILDEHRESGPVVDAVLADADLSERQKQVLLDVYTSFRKEHPNLPEDSLQEDSRPEGSPPEGGPSEGSWSQGTGDAEAPVEARSDEQRSDDRRRGTGSAPIST